VQRQESINVFFSLFFAYLMFVWNNSNNYVARELFKKNFNM